MAKTETMTIAFPNGGIIPSEITGGKERAVPAHEAVDVPKVYGDQLVTDRFAYAAEAAVQPAPMTVAERKQLETLLERLRAEHEKATDVEQKAKLSVEIAEIVSQLG